MDILSWLIVLVLFVIPVWVIMWKLYQKAGYPGWSAIVPVYSLIVMAKIAKKPVAIGWIAGVSQAVMEVMRLTVGNGSPIEKLAALTYLVLGLYLLNAFVKRYDRGIDTWVLYIFLPFIGVFIVDKANLKGNTGGPTAPVSPMTATTPTPFTPVAPAAPVQPTTPLPPTYTAPPTPPTPPATPPTPPANPA